MMTGRNFHRSFLAAASQLLLAASLAVSSAQAANPKPELPPLDSDGRHHPGKFVWADLVTDNGPAAQKFYSQLLGWEFRDVGGYAIATNHGRPVCGLLQRARPTDRPAKPRWIVFISVPSVAEAQKGALARGALVRAAPQVFPRRGEQAVFADAEGAAFGVINSSAGDPEDSLVEPGGWIWMQLLSRNTVAAADFYEAVCGYEAGANTLSGRTDSRLLSSGGYARAAVRTIPADHPEVTPTWLPFVRVAVTAKAVARAKELGGTVLVEPSPELFEGRVAVVADPTGAAIGLLEWNEPQKGATKP